MRRLPFAVLALALAMPTAAQSPNPVAEPELNDVFFRIEAGKLIPLERQDATMHGQAHGFIVMNMKTASEFPGSKSPVRFKSEERLEFVVRSIAAISTADPAAIYSLRKLNSKKKSRELVVMGGHITPVGSSVKTNFAGIPLPVDFSKYGTSSFKLVTQPLPPGEYAVGRPYGPTVFCFGID